MSRPELTTVAAMHQEMLRPALARLSAALGAVLLAASIATAQQPPAQIQSMPQAQPPQAAPPPGQPPQADAPPPAPPRAGLPTPPEVIGAIGRFIDQSISNLGAGVDAGVKGAGETLGGASGAAGDLAKGVTDAAGAVVRLPLSNVVAGFERCAVAPNGAPDCNVASVALCKTRGFQRGNSLDITSSRKCPAQVWLERRQPNDNECINEAFVSRAICQ
jgi:hypothetical protein